jgi:hypothetical protein
MALMNLIAHVGELGFGPILTGQGREPLRNSEINGAFVAVAATSGFLALLYSIAVAVAGKTALLAWPTSQTLLLIAGSALTGVALVMDQAAVGLLKPHLVLGRSLAFSALRLALLAASIALSGDTGLLSVWVMALAGATIAVLPCVNAGRAGGGRLALDIGSWRARGGSLGSHHVLSLVALLPSLVLPYLVGTLLSPATNASFYAAWQISNVAHVLPSSIASVALSLDAKRPSRAPLAISLGLCVALVAAAALAGVLILERELVMSLFNPTYVALGASALGLVALGIPLGAIKYHFVALRRLEGRMAQASVVLATSGVTEVAGTVIGVTIGQNLPALLIGWLLGGLLGTLWMIPALVSGVVLARRSAQ